MSGIQWDQADKSDSSTSRKQTSHHGNSAERRTSLTHRRRTSLGARRIKSPPQNQRNVQSPDTDKKEEASRSILSPPPSMRRSMTERPQFKSPPMPGQGKAPNCDSVQDTRNTPQRPKSGSKTNTQIRRKRRNSRSPSLRRSKSRSPTPVKHKSKSTAKSPKVSMKQSNTATEGTMDIENSKSVIKDLKTSKHLKNSHSVEFSKNKLTKDEHEQNHSSPNRKGLASREKKSGNEKGKIESDQSNIKSNTFPASKTEPSRMEPVGSPTLYSEPVPEDKLLKIEDEDNNVESMEHLDDANIFTDSFVMDTQSAKLLDGATSEKENMQFNKKPPNKAVDITNKQQENLPTGKVLANEIDMDTNISLEGSSENLDLRIQESDSSRECSNEKDQVHFKSKSYVDKDIKRDHVNGALNEKKYPNTNCDNSAFTKFVIPSAMNSSSAAIFSQGLDLSQDGAVDQYMQDFCTQNAIVAQTASPLLPKLVQKKRSHDQSNSDNSGSQLLMDTTEDDLNQAVAIGDASTVTQETSPEEIKQPVCKEAKQLFASYTGTVVFHCNSIYYQSKV